MARSGGTFQPPQDGRLSNQVGATGRKEGFSGEEALLGSGLTKEGRREGLRLSPSELTMPELNALVRASVRLVDVDLSAGPWLVVASVPDPLADHQ